ncbi:MAG: 2-amino-4-hydroxy-6-hydroxymethyldihydropteridine diphosphokinase [Acidimicrobiia bacterium]
MSIAYLGLGSNLGDRLTHLQSAVDGLAARAGTVVAVSAVYETEPMGGPAQPDYLNAVVALDTTLDPHSLLELAKALEGEAGRPSDGERWGPRPLDIDILMIGDARVDDPDLVVPHPRIHQRGFVLAPLADVAPDVVVAPAAGWRGVRRTPLGLRVSE